MSVAADVAPRAVVRRRPRLPFTPQLSLRRLNDQMVEVVEELHRDQGDVAVFYLGRQRVIYLSDPRLARRLFTGHADTLLKYSRTRRWWLRRPAYRYGVGEMGGDAFTGTHDPRLHLAARRAVHPLLSRQRIAAAAPASARVTQRALERLAGPRELDLYHQADVLLLIMAVDFLLGVELEPDEASAIVETVNLGQETVSRETFSSTARVVSSLLRHPRSSLEQGRAFLAIRPFVDDVARRADPVRVDELRGAFARANAPDGDRFIGKLFLTSLGAPAGLMLAMMHVTASPLAERLRAEARGRLDRGALDPGVDVFKDLPLARAVTWEGLRLGPTTHQVGRTCTEALAAEGVELRRGDYVFSAPFQVHRDPRFFVDPLAYDPDRWLRPGEVDTETYFPFGIGSRKCAGADLVDASMTVAAAVLAADWEVETEARVEEIAWAAKPNGDVKPRRPVRGVLRPRASRAGSSR